MESKNNMLREQESFWDAECLAVITDGTKPAMKWTIDESVSRGKKVYIVDISEPDKGTFKDISELPSDVEHAVIGVTRKNPAHIMEDMEKKGIKQFWIHWKTETPDVEKICLESRVKCITGRCPMMYLARGINIHTMHRGIAKLLGKY